MQEIRVRDSVGENAVAAGGPVCGLVCARSRKAEATPEPVAKRRELVAVCSANGGIGSWGQSQWEREAVSRCLWCPELIYCPARRVGHCGQTYAYLLVCTGVVVQWLSPL